MLNIYNVSDTELLNYLLTSEFDDNEISSEMMKFLLLKFKTFYRIQYSRNQILKDNLDKKILDSDFEIQFLKEKIEKEKIEKENSQRELFILNNSLKNRKLTFKERWKGRLD